MARKLLSAEGRTGLNHFLDDCPGVPNSRWPRVAYAAVPLLSDGSEGAPLELRDLFKQFLDEVAPRA
jgi:hypothetical protein